MRILLAVPDPKPLEADLIRQIQSFGFDGIRQDVHGDDHEVMWAQVRSLAAVPECFPILLLFPGTMQRSDGKPWEPDAMLAHLRDECQKLHAIGFVEHELAIEIGNEADLACKRWKKNPEELGKLYKECVGIVKSYSGRWHCLSPSISNLDEDSLDYLRDMALPVGSEIAFHRYPAGRGGWSAQRGFRTRGDEVTTLKTIVHGAPLWNTETGWAEINRDYTLTELEVAERMADEVRFWRDAGCRSFTAYQINSGTWKAADSDDHKRLSTYGARRVDGSWKQWAAAVKEAIA